MMRHRHRRGRNAERLPWSEAIAELAILGMGVVWLLAMLRHWELRIELPPGWLPALLFLSLVVIQSLSLPSWLVSPVSPGAAILAQEAWAFTDGGAGTMALSLDSHATWRMVLKFLALALLFLVVYNTYRTRSQVRRAIWVMIGMGTLIALFGIAQRVTWNGRFYWIGPQAPTASAFGPFVNRTHFAGLIVAIVPMALALAGRRDPKRRRNRRDWRERLRAWNSREGGPTSLIPWLVLLMGAAALVGGSRGGVVALLAALLVMIGLGARGGSGARRVWQIALATGLIVLTAIWIGGDILYGTIEHLAEEVSQPQTSLRLHIWADALQLWQRFPTFGTGLGTFGVVFPTVRTLPALLTFTHAESDWVELLVDTGAIGLLLALLTVGMLGLALHRCYREAASHWTRAIALGGLVALVGTMVQGIANFNLPVMSNFVYLGVAVALSLRSGGMTELRGDTP
jgi:O-antigen ligase